MEVEVDRLIEIDRVSYVYPSSMLEIQFLSQLPGSEKFPGTYSRFDSGAIEKFAVECRLGGQFDRVAPQLEYPISFRTLTLGSSVNDLRPVINKAVARFSVTPELPQGLELDPVSGQVSGQPLKLAP